MTDTMEKLLEAKYFWRRMGEVRSDREAFKYNLSAFLSAARSVTFIMQKEFADVPGFRKWYAEKQAEMRSDATTRLLNEKRVVAIHQKPVRPRAQVSIHVGGQITPRGSVSHVIIRADGTREEVENDGSTDVLPPAEPVKRETTPAISEWRWYFDDLPDNDVLSVCEKHIAKLEALVGECETQFGPNRI